MKDDIISVLLDSYNALISERGVEECYDEVYS